MTEIIFFKNNKEQIKKFEVKGHADLDIKGKDVLCAAVSTLASHTIGAIQEFTNEPCMNTIDEENAKVIFSLSEDEACEIASAFLNAFASSSEELAYVYPENIKVVYKEI